MSKKGFTLIELLILIAIIGILATIVVLRLDYARRKGEKATAMSMARSVLPELGMRADK